MGTRIRKNPVHAFELFCEIGIPSDTSANPWISWMFPYNFKKEEILKSVPGFAYPCEFSNNAVQHFSFVLTNIDSQWTFGFCRHASHSSTCYVFLSYLPWHEVFYKALNHVAELSSKEKAENSKDMQLFLQNFYEAEVPEPGLELHVLSRKNEDFVAMCPDSEKLPSIPENRNMTEYFSAIDAHNMMTIFASMLHERRILITSKKLSRLSACVQAANALIYPMHWQHIFIPVLPKHLTDYLSAPMPFLIGIPSTTLARMKSADMGEIVFLDADENKIETPFADLDALPSEILQSLRHDLKHPHEKLGDAVARAFLRALVKLIGGYWNALKLKHGERITFSPEMFVQTRPSAMQPFLQKMLELQIFQQFIESRLKNLNSGRGVNDEFEFELAAHEDKASFRLRNQYREWVSNMKKEGGAFLKNVRTKVKDTGKKAYKDIRSRINNHKVMVDIAPDVPKRHDSVPTILNGLENHRINHVMKHDLYSTLFETEDLSSKQKEPKCSVTDSPQLTFQPIDMDLMGDLHELIFRRCSLCSDSFQKRTSISDPQLINLALASDATPCSPDCVATHLKQALNIPEKAPDPTPPPPLLPRPPQLKGKVGIRTSSVSSEPPESLPKLLIELDSDVSCTSHTTDDLFSFEVCSSPPKLPERNNFLSSHDQPLSNRNFLNTNPFYQNVSSSVFQSNDSCSIYKSSSGPSVRNMVNMWQTPPTAKETSYQCLSTSADKLKVGGTSVATYRSQLLSRTQSTPPTYTSANSNLHQNPSMLVLKSASKVSTNPFIVADSRNNNDKENTSTENSANSSWENFH
ncbi:DENN domain-containing protein 1A-like [Uloborus diversus]|uniref:DENN domain-containing protein 1A-like n=1 Tax=Uloborus diversus TaxID=327109 RepID=UPI00240A7EAE|nr:DENN domain-containing protein 1A-like [Uloborus diversus]